MYTSSFLIIRTLTETHIPTEMIAWCEQYLQNIATVLHVHLGVYDTQWKGLQTVIYVHRNKYSIHCRQSLVHDCAGWWDTLDMARLLFALLLEVQLPSANVSKRLGSWTICERLPPATHFRILETLMAPHSPPQYQVQQPCCPRHTVFCICHRVEIQSYL